MNKNVINNINEFNEEHNYNTRKVDGKNIFDTYNPLKEELLLELKRSQLINKSKNGASYAPNNRKKGKNRFERRKYSKISTSIKGYNKIDMNAFWKGDILEVKIEVIGETDTYTVTLDFENILYNLKKEVKTNNNVFNFKTIYKALVKAFNDDDVYMSCTCLHPDTKIKLLDGTCPTVAEMKTRFEAGEKLYVYSTDDKGDFKPGEVEKVWVTGEKTEFIKVTLDSGKEIITTPDHLYMLKDGSYIPAEDLTEGQSLMFTSIDEAVSYFKLNHKVVKIERITLDSTPVYDIKVKDWENFVVEAGVVLHNCPDWRYRFGYVATKNKYSSQLPPELRPSNITNPKDDKGAGCKHTLLLLSNTGWLVKIASVIYNYVKYCKKNLSTNYKRYIFPQIYGMSYKQALDNQIFKEVNSEDSGLLPSDQKTLDSVIDMALKGRDEKGRFTKDNEYKFSKKDLRNLN